MIRLNSAADVAALLSIGRRVEAAMIARRLAAPAAAPVRELVSVLADALASLGDATGSRGRPKASAASALRRQPGRAIAVLHYHVAVLARRIVDCDSLTAAEYEYFAGVEGLRTSAREPLEARARAVLSELRLDPRKVPRRGFRGATLRRIAQRCRLSVDVLRRELAR